MCTNELETVAKVQTPDTYTLVTGPGCYDNRIRRHVQAGDWQTVTIQIEEELATNQQQTIFITETATGIFTATTSKLNLE